jgi:hypothetical protein
VNGLAPKLTDAGLDSTVLYAVGAFNGFNQTPPVTRHKVAEIRTADGSLTDWNPNANTSATLLAVASSRDAVYVGGTGLDSIGGSNDVKNLAAVDQNTALATSWNPQPNGVVNSIRWRRGAIRDSVNLGQQLPTVLVAGNFTQIGNPDANGQQSQRSHVAELGASDSGNTTPWNPSLSSPGGAGYDVLPISTNETIVAGVFSTVGTSARSVLAETDRFTGKALDWNPDLDAGAFELNYGPINNEPADGYFTGPPLIVAGGRFGTGNPPYPRRLLAFYCRSDLPANC